MFVEKTIEVCVKDHTDDRSAQIRLGVDKTIGQVRPQILEPLAAPLEDDSGEPITYVLYNLSHEDKPHLQDTQTVGQVLADGHVVQAVPEIIAGI